MYPSIYSLHGVPNKISKQNSYRVKDYWGDGFLLFVQEKPLVPPTSTVDPQPLYTVGRQLVDHYNTGRLGGVSLSPPCLDLLIYFLLTTFGKGQHL